MDSAISAGGQFYIASNGTNSAVEINLNYTGFAVDMSVGRDGTLYISDYYKLLAYNVQTNRFEALATFNTIKNALGYDDQGNFYAAGGPGRFIDVISGSTYSVLDTIQLPFPNSVSGVCLWSVICCTYWHRECGSLRSILTQAPSSMTPHTDFLLRSG